MKIGFLAILAVIGGSACVDIETNNTYGYIDQTNWRETLMKEKYQGEIEKISNEPRTITQRVTAAPKVLTERITAEPRIIKEEIEMPIRQRIITQPTILNE